MNSFITWSLLFCIIYLNIGINFVYSFTPSRETKIPKPAERIRYEPESVWIEFIQLALDNKPLNLGQGFPDFAAPQYLIDSLNNATNTQNQTQILNNQYTRSFGHPRLVQALQRYYKEFRGFEKELNNENTQFLVTVGGYEAIYVSIMAFVDPDDEVLLIDPAFDAYAPIVKLAQGKNIYIPLRPPTEDGNQSASSSSNFKLNMTEFESKITNKTKLLVLNTPNNPLGKIYSKDELQAIADLCIKYNILVMADEVYEQLYYERKHESIASLPGMWERTITIGSAGKTFSVTGWKIGWAFGPEHLIKYLQLVHQNAVYTVATPLQEAVARAIEHELELKRSGKVTYWDKLRVDLVEKRERMGRIFRYAKLRPIIPEGGYFMLADFSPLALQFPQYKEQGYREGKENTNDYKFARWMSRAMKLQGIPASAFYSVENKPLAKNLMRFCFIKQKETLDKLELLLLDR